MESRKYYYRMDRSAIHMLRFLLEAYDGIASLSTLDSQEGRVVLCVPPGCETEMGALLEEIAHEFMIQPVSLFKAQELEDNACAVENQGAQFQD